VIGANPDPDLVGTLVARCAIEPNFHVRDTLTWALIRLPAEIAMPRVVAELRSELPQARSQALHTLSKIRNADAWPAISSALLRDPDDEVARSAWRAAVILVPEGEKVALAEELATQFGRGDRNVQLSLSRALVALGAQAVEPVLRNAKASDDPGIRAHASATERLLHNPEAGFELDLQEAKRVFILSKER
jgi:HEAT repeat protein